MASMGHFQWAAGLGFPTLFSKANELRWCLCCSTFVAILWLVSGILLAKGALHCASGTGGVGLQHGDAYLSTRCAERNDAHLKKCDMFAPWYEGELSQHSPSKGVGVDAHREMRTAKEGLQAVQPYWEAVERPADWLWYTMAGDLAWMESDGRQRLRARPDMPQHDKKTRPLDCLTDGRHRPSYLASPFFSMATIGALVSALPWLLALLQTSSIEDLAKVMKGKTVHDPARLNLVESLWLRIASNGWGNYVFAFRHLLGPYLHAVSFAAAVYLADRTLDGLFVLLPLHYYLSLRVISESVLTDSLWPWYSLSDVIADGRSPTTTVLMFPPQAVCEVTKYGPSGSAENRDVICTLGGTNSMRKLIWVIWVAMFLHGIFLLVTLIGHHLTFCKAYRVSKLKSIVTGFDAKDSADTLAKHLGVSSWLKVRAVCKTVPLDVRNRVICDLEAMLIRLDDGKAEGTELVRVDDSPATSSKVSLPECTNGELNSDGLKNVIVV